MPVHSISICLFPVHNKYGLLQPYVQGNGRHTRCAYTPVPHLGLTSASTWSVHMHVTESHVCKCTTMYSKRFFVISTTLTCILQMSIWLCENACIYALDVQRVNVALTSAAGNVIIKSHFHKDPYFLNEWSHPSYLKISMESLVHVTFPPHF